jgi:hypothetical protein
MGKLPLQHRRNTTEPYYYGQPVFYSSALQLQSRSLPLILLCSTVSTADQLVYVRHLMNIAHSSAIPVLPLVPHVQHSNESANNNTNGYPKQHYGARASETMIWSTCIPKDTL